MEKHDFLERIKGKLIVSCQALPNEPLHGSLYMSKMALAAKMGGAVAIRTNGVEDCIAIRKATNLPIIGLIKQDYPDSPVYITPSKKEIKELIEAEVDVIALDATIQERPNKETLEEMVQYIKNSSNCLIMGDVSTFEEGLAAIHAGVDLVSTTLSSYTPYTKDRFIPDLPLIEKLARVSSIPIIAEGNIKTPEEASKSLELGAYAVVVGTAITRPQIITKQFSDAVRKTSEMLMQIKRY